jgi:hypothetical protein
MSRLEDFDAVLDELPWGPSDYRHDEPTNAERAARAMRALSFYEHMVWFNPTADLHNTAMQDLMSDTIHLCRRQGIDYEAMFAGAIAMADCEVVECEEGDLTPVTEGWGA